MMGPTASAPPSEDTSGKQPRTWVRWALWLGLGFVLTTGFAGAGGAMAAVALLTNTVDRIDVDEPEDVERLQVRSESLNEPLELEVLLPPGYAEGAEDERYPVIWVLDGRRLADPLYVRAQTLAQVELAEPAIVVAVPSSSLGRGVDFFPPDPEYGGQAGQADRFLAFLEHDAIPALAREYRVSDTRMLAGHSLGGLFVSYSLVERPSLFSARFAFSPSWWAGEGAMVEALCQANIEGSALFYASLGEREAKDMARAFERVEACRGQGQGAGNLRWMLERIPHADHHNCPELSAGRAFAAYGSG